MAKEHYSDLLALIAVAREQSFTRAASQLGISQSMLSHSIQRLEARVGVRLLTRTTRSVSVTEAGERLLNTVEPRLREIETELIAVAEFGDTPAGNIRITATDHVIETVLWPKLAQALPKYPQISVEVVIDYGLTDIVADHFDFGIRLGDGLANGIEAVRIAPDMRFVMVGAPSYMESRAMPTRPQDLMEHECINMRLPTRGGLYAWELEKDGQEINTRVKGRLVFNGINQILDAAVSGFGLAYVPEDIAHPHLVNGTLVPVMQAWWRTFPGLHLYYSSEREKSRAMQVLIDELRYPG
ncbi:LysR family transcriptional regulator [Pseudomonas sp. Cab53]|jgi:DNA-binding transcriptional LysR family regulator|uniref:Putative transcription factor, LysR family n=1 Tax=Pseudomonas brassicacearum (strain NFM421) TaxID=994484 RepID=F2KA30_PSEBN|nr:MULTISPECIES: LysR family transcriptional regulator [Pseudomonas]AEA68321.1 putative transcription factor, LysR family [Pseudomonas brassicacearum subsp. brassicacearum NFM421]BBH32692.1 LysR family transcriptional regulator [Pseudomonas sp. St290]BBP65707.1 LysR family transcriptional regulator [Pseudomonas sp. Cab53]GFM83159.1 LysR family transcriptional regulator [Pseudomonas cichorii]